MHLHTLLSQLRPRPSVAGVPNVVITGLAEDSRLVAPGDLFIARAGTKTDGAAFVRDAFAKGAVAAIVAGRTADCARASSSASTASAAASPGARCCCAGEPAQVDT